MADYDEVTLLNTLVSYAHDDWREVRANKDHVDMFGDKVENGEWYWKRKSGAGFHCVDKLSDRSMDTFLHLVLKGTDVKNVARVAAEKQFEINCHKDHVGISAAD